MTLEVTAVVPMRHVSMRVPGKNYRVLAGAPLYAHILRSLLACRSVARVVVSTDSPIITQGCAQEFPSVHILERPEHLRADTVPMNEVLLHVAESVEAEHLLQTHCTNPLLRPETIEEAISRYEQALGEHDSLFSVTRLQTRLWDEDGRPMNHDPSVLLRTQDLPPVFEENSCLFLFSRAVLERRRNRMGDRPQMFTMEPLEALDIDEEHEFERADYELTRRQQAAQ